MVRALDMAAIEAELKSLNSSWLLVSGGIHKISREFKFKNFSEALNFVNKVGELAETKNHHPDIVLKWAYVKIELWTHDIGGLSSLDFELARGIEAFRV